jgi:hypothetical protein
LNSQAGRPVFDPRPSACFLQRSRTLMAVITYLVDTFMLAHLFLEHSCDYPAEKRETELE